MKFSKIFLLIMLLLVSACAVIDHGASSPPLQMNAKWAMLPITNQTDVPQAGLRAEAISEALLRNRGVNNLLHYPSSLNQDSLFEPAERKATVDALKWAHEQGVRYALTGAVDEWHYKVGMDGEPAVGITLQVIDLGDNDKVVWSAVGAKSGWSRDSLSGVAQKLIKDLLAGATIK